MHGCIEFCDTWNVHPNSIKNTWAVLCHTKIAWTSLEHWQNKTAIFGFFNSEDLQFATCSDVFAWQPLKPHWRVKHICEEICGSPPHSNLESAAFFRMLPKKNQLVGGFNPFEKKCSPKLGARNPPIFGVEISKTYLSCHHLESSFYQSGALKNQQKKTQRKRSS